MNWLKHKALNSFASEKNFDCTKMKLLIEDKSSQNFNDRFRNWIAECTKNSKDKVWRDVEYSQFS